MVQCAIRSCKMIYRYREKFVSFHSFPRDKRLRKKWLTICRRKDLSSLKQLKSWHAICSMHFAPECFNYHLTYDDVKLTLIPGSIPTVNIPKHGNTIGNPVPYEDHIGKMPAVQEYFRRQGSKHIFSLADCRIGTPKLNPDYESGSMEKFDATKEGTKESEEFLLMKSGWSSESLSFGIPEGSSTSQTPPDPLSLPKKPISRPAILRRTSLPAVPSLPEPSSQKEGNCKRIKVEELHQNNIRLLQTNAPKMTESGASVSNTLKVVPSNSEKNGKGLMLVVQDAETSTQDAPRIFVVKENGKFKHLIQMAVKSDGSVKSQQITASEKTVENANESQPFLTNLDNSRISMDSGNKAFTMDLKRFMIDKDGKIVKRPRKVLPLDQKIEVLDRLAQGESAVSVGRTMGINESSVRSIRSNADAIRSSVASGTPTSAKVTYFPREKNLEKMERALAVWITEQYENRVPLTVALIRQRAKRIYEHLLKVNEEDGRCFQASKGWYVNFKRRQSMEMAKIIADVLSADGSREKGEAEMETSDDSLLGTVPNTSSMLTDARINESMAADNPIKEELLLPDFRIESTHSMIEAMPGILHCRLCASQVNKGVHIFKDNASIATKINTYLPVKVFDNGQFPEEICSRCEEDLERTVDFFNRLNKGQKELISRLERTRNGKDLLARHSEDYNKESSIIADKSSSSERDNQSSHSRILPNEPDIRLKEDPVEFIDIKEEKPDFSDTNSDYSHQMSALEVDIHVQSNPPEDHTYVGNTCQQTERSVNAHERGASDEEDASGTLTASSEDESAHPGTTHIKLLIDPLDDKTPDGSSREDASVEQMEKCHIASTASIQTLEVPKGQTYLCQTCGTKFLNEGAFRHHWCTALSDGVMPYKCYYCGKRYTHCSQLVKHVRTHAGQKMYSCEKCGEKFSNSMQLKQHLEAIHHQQPSEEVTNHIEHTSMPEKKIVISTRKKKVITSNL